MALWKLPWKYRDRPDERVMSEPAAWPDFCFEMQLLMMRFCLWQDWPCSCQGPYTVPNYDLYGHHHHSKPFKVGLNNLFDWGIFFHSNLCISVCGTCSHCFFEAFFFSTQKMQDKSDFLQREVHSSADPQIRSVSHQNVKILDVQKRSDSPSEVVFLACLLGTPCRIYVCMENLKFCCCRIFSNDSIGTTFEHFGQAGWATCHKIKGRVATGHRILVVSFPSSWQTVDCGVYLRSQARKQGRIPEVKSYDFDGAGTWRRLDGFW